MICYIYFFFVYQEGDVIPNSVGVGDKVLVPEYGGTKLVFDEEVSNSYIVIVLFIDDLFF